MSFQKIRTPPSLKGPGGYSPLMKAKV
jgi:hypothetical protein